LLDRVSSAASAVLLAALVFILYDRGGPYFERPPTVVEHVFREKHETRDALLALPLVRPLLPRGAKVTCFRPSNGKWQWDVPNLHAAVVSLPQQFVVPGFAASEDIPKYDLAQYVIAINEPFASPDYRLVAEFPTARLYKVVR
jgi:hypothetical protein